MQIIPLPNKKGMVNRNKFEKNITSLFIMKLIRSSTKDILMSIRDSSLYCDFNCVHSLDHFLRFADMTFTLYDLASPVAFRAINLKLLIHAHPDVLLLDRHAFPITAVTGLNIIIIICP
jgi:hypothetical protein